MRKVSGSVMASEVISSVVVGGSRGSVVGMPTTEVISVGSEMITFVVIGSRGSEVGIFVTDVITAGSEVTTITLVSGSGSDTGVSATLVASGIWVSLVAVPS